MNGYFTGLPWAINYYTPAGVFSKTKQPGTVWDNMKQVETIWNIFSHLPLSQSQSLILHPQSFLPACRFTRRRRAGMASFAEGPKGMPLAYAYGTSFPLLLPEI